MRFLFLSLSIAIVSGLLGIDASAGPFSPDSFACLKKQNLTYAIFRAYRSTGIVDPAVVANIKNAHAGGINDVDVYIFPCFKCGKPKMQIINTVNALKGQNYNRIWIDVERREWGSKADNRKFLTEIFEEAPKHGKPVGIYTSESEWSVIVGNDWTAGSKFPLWWPRWNNNPTLDDFKPFAGWTKIVMKQYIDNKTTCKINYDMNFKR